MSYTVCPNCGQKALTVATRCPRCGLPFESQFFQHAVKVPRRKRIPPGLIVALLLVTAVVGNALWQLVTIAPSPPGAARLAVTPRPPTPRPIAPRETVVAAVETLPPLPTPTAAPPAESVRSTPVAAAPTPSVARIVAAGPAARLYASTWMNVRASRRNTAPVLRVLRPGEAVQVDSLEQGWYRVLSDEDEPGYVDHRLLAANPPLP